MIIFALALLCVGGFVALFSGLWTLALAFQRNLYWGIAVLFFPVGNVAFAYARWREAKVPFLLGMGSLTLVASAFFAMPKDSIRFPVESALTSIFGSNQSAQAAEQRMVDSRHEAELQLRLAELKLQESRLMGRRSNIAPEDIDGAIALSAEIKRFNSELHDVLAELHLKGLAAQ